MRRVALCAGWLLLLAMPNHAAAEPVGVRGQPERLTLEGASTFSAKQIKDALFGDFDVFLAAGSSKPLDDYLKTIKRRIEAGYRHAGFPAVTVSASLDAKSDKVVVKLSEGPRFPAGDIRVTGAKTVPTAQLIDYLLKPQPPKDATPKSFIQSNGKMEPVWVDRDGKEVSLSDPVWTPDKPAPFLNEPEEDSTLHEDVGEALAKLGYFFPKFSVDVVPDTATKKASLVINISDEGPKCVLSNVTITGNKLNSREEIFKYLAIKPDATLTGDELVRIKRLLWRSGRFIKFDVTPTEPASPGEKGELQIDLVELKSAPPLSKPFSREEAILQKCRDWLANPAQWDGDMCLKWFNGAMGYVEFVLSPKHGLFIQARYRWSPSLKHRDGAVAVSSSAVSFHDLSNGRSLSIPLPNIRKSLSFTFVLDDDANEKSEDRQRFRFDFHFTSDPCDPKSPLPVNLIADPVFFVDLAHDCDAKYDIRDGVLTVTNYYSILRIDAHSGKLLDVTLLDTEEDGPEASSKTSNDKGGSARSKSIGRIWFSPDEFQRCSKEVAASVRKSANAFRSTQPVSSILAVLCRDDQLWQQLAPEADPKAREVVARMLDRQVCEPLDDLVRNLVAASGGDKFTIPPDRSGQSNAQMAAIAVWTWRIARQWFPPDSWPDTLARAVILGLVGQGNAAADDWKQLLSSDDFGPVYSLVAISLLKQNPGLANMLRSQGLRHLTVQDVRKEYPLFLDHKYPIGKCARCAATILRELDDADIRSLSTLLPDGSATAFRQWAARWRQDRKRSPDEAMQTLLDALWQNGLRELVADQMKTASFQFSVQEATEKDSSPDGSKETKHADKNGGEAQDGKNPAIP